MNKYKNKYLKYKEKYFNLYNDIYGGAKKNVASQLNMTDDVVLDANRSPYYFHIMKTKKNDIFKIIYLNKSKNRQYAYVTYVYLNANNLDQINDDFLTNKLSSIENNPTDAINSSSSSSSPTMPLQLSSLQIAPQLPVASSPTSPLQLQLASLSTASKLPATSSTSSSQHQLQKAPPSQQLSAASQQLQRILENPKDVKYLHNLYVELLANTSYSSSSSSSPSLSPRTAHNLPAKSSSSSQLPATSSQTPPQLPATSSSQLLAKSTSSSQLLVKSSPSSSSQFPATSTRTAPQLPVTSSSQLLAKSSPSSSQLPATSSQTPPQLPATSSSQLLAKSTSSSQLLVKSSPSSSSQFPATSTRTAPQLPVTSSSQLLAKSSPSSSQLPATSSQTPPQLPATSFDYHSAESSSQPVNVPSSYHPPVVMESPVLESLSQQVIEPSSKQYENLLVHHPSSISEEECVDNTCATCKDSNTPFIIVTDNKFTKCHSCTNSTGVINKGEEENLYIFECGHVYCIQCYNKSNKKKKLHKNIYLFKFHNKQEYTKFESFSKCDLCRESHPFMLILNFVNRCCICFDNNNYIVITDCGKSICLKCHCNSIQKKKRFKFT